MTSPDSSLDLATLKALAAAFNGRASDIKSRRLRIDAIVDQDLLTLAKVYQLLPR